MNMVNSGDRPFGQKSAAKDRNAIYFVGNIPANCRKIYVSVVKWCLVVKFNPEDYSALGLAMNLALAIAVPLLAGIFLGQYLGEKFGNPPLFILLCVLLGLFAGFRQAIRLLLKK